MLEKTEGAIKNGQP